jgi:hypothetical protein
MLYYLSHNPQPCVLLVIFQIESHVLPWTIELGLQELATTPGPQQIFFENIIKAV